jgi:hypothetical protein
MLHVKICRRFVAHRDWRGYFTDMRCSVILFYSNFVYVCVCVCVFSLLKEKVKVKNLITDT